MTIAVTSYTGDLLLKYLDDEGNLDLEFTNGQPAMTNGLETLSILAVFGEDWWGNAIAKTDAEKMKSTFPEIIRRNVITDATRNDGTKALERALRFLKSEKIAKKVVVTGQILSAYGIGWEIEIESIMDKTIKYFINWEKGCLTSGLVV